MNGSVVTIDLLPVWRRRRSARRVAVARWTSVCVLVLVGSLAPAAATALSAPGSPREPEFAGRIARAERSIETLKAEQPVLRRELASLQRTAALLSAIEDRPDWRPLLHALNTAAGSARFERIETALVRDGSPHVRVSVLALVPDLTEARAMALRFEDLGLFEDVVLSNPVRITVGRTDVVRCEINARMRLRSTP